MTLKYKKCTQFEKIKRVNLIICSANVNQPILSLWTDTSRKPKVDEKVGQMYLFMSRSEMETDIKCGRFLEHGEYDGNLYGTKIDSIHEIVDSGKICILDVNPQVLF